MEIEACVPPDFFCSDIFVFVVKDQSSCIVPLEVSLPVVWR
jgi:hypothetical protein